MDGFGPPTRGDMVGGSPAMFGPLPPSPQRDRGGGQAQPAQPAARAPPAWGTFTDTQRCEWLWHYGTLEQTRAVFLGRVVSYRHVQGKAGLPQGWIPYQRTSSAPLPA